MRSVVARILPLCLSTTLAAHSEIIVYFGNKHGGGSRRLFRKVSSQTRLTRSAAFIWLAQIGNRSSRFYPNQTKLRKKGSYVYEELLKNGKDLKVQIP